MNPLTRQPAAVAALVYRDPDPADLEPGAECWTGINRDAQRNVERARAWRAEQERRRRAEGEGTAGS
jgi:hypothetical protein